MQDEATSGEFTFRLADLKVICQLGMGSSGVVNKVQHRTTGDVYALKVCEIVSVRYLGWYITW